MDDRLNQGRKVAARGLAKCLQGLTARGFSIRQSVSSKQEAASLKRAVLCDKPRSPKVRADSENHQIYACVFAH